MSITSTDLGCIWSYTNERYVNNEPRLTCSHSSHWLACAMYRKDHQVSWRQPASRCRSDRRVHQGRSSAGSGETHSAGWYLQTVRTIIRQGQENKPPKMKYKGEKVLMEIVTHKPVECTTIFRHLSTSFSILHIHRCLFITVENLRIASILSRW